jgi:serine/threonine protein kinase
MVFTGNQYSVVSDVFAGHTDVGMVRSDLLEGLQLPAPYCNATAEAAVGLACYPAGTFKIIGPRLQAGYPFNTSTQLWPEWPVAALAHVELDTQKAVAEALFAFGRSAVSLPYVIPGRVASFTPSLDYVAVRDMQHAQALVVNGTCLTASQVFDSILCMPGTFRRSRNAIDAECLARGLVCPAGQACVCSPCATLPPVPISMSISLASSANVSECARMQLCLQPAQNLQLVLTVTDEWFDARAELGLPPVTQVELRYSEATLITANQNSIAVPKDGDGVWSLRVAPTNTGLFIIEAFADGVALDMSPTLLSIVSPTCAGNDASADASGACVCAKRHVASGPNGDCVAVPAFSVAKVAGGSAGGAAALVLIIVAVVVIMHRRNEALWRIPRDAVTFMEPSEVLGRGTFGMVLKGKYRGTTVALKRSLALEPRTGRAMVDSEISAASIHLQLQFNMHAASRDGGPAPPEMPSLDSLTNKIPETPAGVRCSGSGGCASRSNSATGTSSILPVICAGFCPALDSVLFGLWQRKKAASLRTDFIREMRLLVHLRHPHILTVLGAVLHESEPILVMEHMDRGSLHDLLHNETLPLEGDVVLQLLRDVVSGMQFLHSADPPILHNDLKAANILVDASFRAKVADFGLSGKRRASRGPPGTPYWMAPELLRDSKPRIMPSTATDVYSFGITLSEVFTRCEPYVEDQGSMDDVLALISALPKPGGPPPKRPSILDIVPPFFQDLMRRCWHAEPAVRPSMSAIAAELNVMADQEGVGAATVTAALTAAKHRHAGERKLLNAMFPPAVARALAEGRRVEAQEFPCVTVFFSDIVGG